MKRMHFAFCCVVLANYLTFESVSAVRRYYNANARIREFHPIGRKITTSPPTQSTTAAQSSTTGTSTAMTTRGLVRSANNVLSYRRRPIRPLDLLLVSSDGDEPAQGVNLLFDDPQKRTLVPSTTTTEHPVTIKKGPFFVSSTPVSLRQFPALQVDGSKIRDQSAIIQTKPRPAMNVFQESFTSKTSLVNPTTTPNPSSVNQKSPFFVTDIKPVKYSTNLYYFTTASPKTFDELTQVKDKTTEIFITTAAPPIMQGAFLTGTKQNRRPIVWALSKPATQSTSKGPLTSSTTSLKPSEDDYYEATTAPPIDDLLDSLLYDEKPKPSRSDIFFATAAPPLNSFPRPPPRNPEKNTPTLTPVNSAEKLLDASTAQPADNFKGPYFNFHQTPSVGAVNKPNFQGIRGKGPSKVSNVHITTEAPPVSNYASTDYDDDFDNYVEEEYYDEAANPSENEDVDIDAIIVLPPKTTFPPKPPSSISFTLNSLKLKRPSLSSPTTLSTTTTTTAATTQRPVSKQSVKQSGTPPMTNNMYNYLPIAQDMSGASYLNDLALNTNSQLEIPLNGSYVSPIIAPALVPSYSPDMMMYQLNSTIEDLILSSYFPMIMNNFTSLMSSIYNNYTMYMNSMFDVTSTTTSASITHPIYWPCINATTPPAESTTAPPPSIGTFYIAPISSISSSVSASSPSVDSSSVSVVSSGGLSSTLLAGFFLILPVAAGIIALFELPLAAIGILFGVGIPFLLFLLFNMTGIAAFGRDKKKYQFKGLEGLATEWDRHSSAILDIIENYTRERDAHYT